MGETAGNVSKGMDTYSYRQPIGVCAGVTPFNFPAMIPLWVLFFNYFYFTTLANNVNTKMFPMAITTGNTFVMKPSEIDPLTPIRLSELAIEAGVPAGVLNVIHGRHVCPFFL